LFLVQLCPAPLNLNIPFAGLMSFVTREVTALPMLRRVRPSVPGGLA
jgi:hypothetical protein